MTNYHVLENLYATDPRVAYSGAAVSVVFDVRDGNPTKKDAAYALARNWDVESSSVKKLDYALLRLARKPSPVRPWIKPVLHEFETSEPLIIIQHPRGTGLKVRFWPIQSPA